MLKSVQLATGGCSVSAVLAESLITSGHHYYEVDSLMSKELH